MVKVHCALYKGESINVHGEMVQTYNLTNDVVPVQWKSVNCYLTIYIQITVKDFKKQYVYNKCLLAECIL